MAKPRLCARRSLPFCTGRLSRLMALQLAEEAAAASKPSGSGNNRAVPSATLTRITGRLSSLSEIFSSAFPALAHRRVHRQVRELRHRSAIGPLQIIFWKGSLMTNSTCRCYSVAAALLATAVLACCAQAQEELAPPQGKGHVV